jgi:hypothetical protein
MPNMPRTAKQTGKAENSIMEKKETTFRIEESCQISLNSF